MVTKAQRIEFERALILEERSPATIEKYCRDVDAFLRFARDSEINKEIVIAYKNQLQENYAPASVNSMLAALNRFFKETGRFDCVVKSVKIQRQAFRDKERELSNYCSVG